MCVSACVRTDAHGDRWCDTIGELAKAIGCHAAQIPIGPGYTRVPAHTCLCPVDMEKLGTKFGYRARRPYSEEWDPMNYLLTRSRASHRRAG